MGSDLVLQAIHGYLEKNVDFIDAFNAAWMLQQGSPRFAPLTRSISNALKGCRRWCPDNRRGIVYAAPSLPVSGPRRVKAILQSRRLKSSRLQSKDAGATSERQTGGTLIVYSFWSYSLTVCTALVVQGLPHFRTTPGYVALTWR
jgi:hypothetical protein